MNKKKYPDVKIGNKYGRWTVIDSYEKNPKNGNHRWLCKCSCDEHTVRPVEEHMLKAGKSLSCGCLKREKTTQRPFKGQTFYDWCIEHERRDLLDRWDYEKNQCSPKDIGMHTGKSYWFKCPNGIHESEPHWLKHVKKGCSTEFACLQCNSFGQWCLDHNRKDLIDRWDDELNGVDCFHVSRGSDKSCWFKCPKGIHESEKHPIKFFTNRYGQYGCKNDIPCNKCNSFGQWAIDNFGDNFFNIYWDKEKNNDINPFKISKASKKKVYFKCVDNKYHGSYEASINSFYNGKRCPYCGFVKLHESDTLGYVYPEVIPLWSNKNEKTPFDYSVYTDKKIWLKCDSGIHDDYSIAVNYAIKSGFKCKECRRSSKASILQNKIEDYLHELGYHILHEFDCNLKPRNPDTGYILPFDNEIPELKLVIETMGEQHYQANNMFNELIAKKNNQTKEEALEERQKLDEYKKNYALDHGYQYLAIPYYYDCVDKYKKVIDRKINEILN